MTLERLAKNDSVDNLKYDTNGMIIFSNGALVLEVRTRINMTWRRRWMIKANLRPNCDVTCRAHEDP
jgi:hypothetical protein